MSVAAQRGWSCWHIASLVVVLGMSVGIAYQVGRGRQAPTFPADDSLEAGFARDMAVHHAQAVDMAEVERTRTADPELLVLAVDIALTQQAQIGQMRGWLDVGGLRPTSTRPAMGWMGHPTTGRMPGMATPDDLGGLRRDGRETVDRNFLRLMIRHHRGGVAMAEAAAEGTDQREVRVLAEAMVNAQQSEIQAMERMLIRLGGEPEPDDDPAHAHVGRQPQGGA
jgi:uncharacterized protein (DUF305 family)